VGSPATLGFIGLELRRRTFVRSSGKYGPSFRSDYRSELDEAAVGNESTRARVRDDAADRGLPLLTFALAVVRQPWHFRSEAVALQIAEEVFTFVQLETFRSKLPVEIRLVSRTIYQILSDHEALLALEPEELAGVLLEHLNSLSEGERGQLNRYNFSLPNTVQEFPREYHERLLRALMEAWSWLEREGLIAQRPGHQGEWVFITRRGSRLASAADLNAYRRANLLPRKLLHPLIAQKVFAAFLRGDYDTAVFQAFREVEIAVRDACHFTPTDLGVALMRKAFDRSSGPLADTKLPEVEREAMAHLFAGAIGLYKNPQSHRSVGIDDPVEATELIVLASQLLRIVDGRASAQ